MATTIMTTTTTTVDGDDDDDDDDSVDAVQDVFKESERGLSRSPTTLDQNNMNAAGQDSDVSGAGHTDRSHGKTTTYDQSRHDRKKNDETRKKMEPSMKWRVLETETSAEDTSTNQETTAGTKGAEKQLRIKSSGRTRSRE